MHSGPRIILCRHGVTDFTVTGRWDGRGGADPALNEQGRAQARELAVRLQGLLGDSPKVRVLSSSLRRAKETAAPVAELLGTQCQPVADWDELAFGEWDGLSGEQLLRDHPDELSRFWADESFRVPGGESHGDLHSRVRPAFESLLAEGGTTVVVTHYLPIMSCISLILGVTLSSARRIELAPASSTGFGSDIQGPVVEFINDLGTRKRP